MSRILTAIPLVLAGPRFSPVAECGLRTQRRARLQARLAAPVVEVQMVVR